MGAGVGTVIVATTKRDFPSVVNGVVVDSELDIQRRRADKLVAATSIRANVT
jgi:hypothetical protein